MISQLIKNENLKKYNNVINKIKNKIENHNGNFKIITHYDTDGLCSGAILIKLLKHLDKKYQITILDQLTKETLDKEIIKNNNDNTLYIFSDMGSGQIEQIIENNLNCIILDHHPVAIKNTEINNILQLNPHIFNINGGKEICGSGVCYLIAREFILYDLSILAIVGAIGDMQHLPFIGFNQFILNEGISTNNIQIVKDIIYNCYDDLSIVDSILFTYSPFIKKLSKKETVINLLNKYGIDTNKKYLDGEDKIKLEKALKEVGVNINEIYLDRYIINHIIPDGHYLSEILNSCGKSKNFEIGINIALGSKEDVVKGKEINYKYKLNIINTIKNIKIIKKNNFNYFIINESGMAGIIAGLLATNSNKPVFGISKTENNYKISSRGNHKLVNEGLNLTEVMKLTEMFGGSGGGHAVASGGIIPIESLGEFLDWADDLIEDQLKN